MGETNTGNSRIEFGPFEVDVAAGQVHKNGRLVRLPEQPFQVLVALLERPGEVVTLEELKEKLWPGQAYGAVDQGLHNAIYKLRDALGDSAATPRFIETLPHRGYRFILELSSNGLPDPLPEPPWKMWRMPALIGIAALAVLGVSSYAIWKPTLRPPLRRFSLRPEMGVGAYGYATPLAISPNGKYLAYAASSPRALWVRDLTVEQPRLIRGSEGARFPFWSPDSEFILYSAGRELRKVSVHGGPSIVICRYRAGFAMGSVSPDGDTVVFADGTPPTLFQVPINGGEPMALFSDDEQKQLYATYTNEAETAIAFPEFLPVEAGDRILLFELGFPNTRVQRMMVLDQDTRRLVALGPGVDKFYSPTGHLVYEKGSDLWAVPFSPKTLQTYGDPFLVRSDSRGPTVASDGTLVFLDRTAQMRQLTWRDRNGSKLGTAGEPRSIPADNAAPRISPDGNYITIMIETDSTGEIWVHNRIRNVTTRLTTDPADDYTSAWSPDGTQIVFSSNRNGDHDIFLNERDRPGEPTPLAATPPREVVDDWSRDGKYILYRVNRRETRHDLNYLERGENAKWRPHHFLQSKASEVGSRFSPNGRFVAYESDESGRREIYVRQFPDGSQKKQISNQGGRTARWRADGKELFYTEGDTLVAVPFDAEREQPIGEPKRLFQNPALATRLWDVSADGQQFLLAEEVGETPEPQIRVVQNWFEEFRGRVKD